MYIKAFNPQINFIFFLIVSISSAVSQVNLNAKENSQKITVYKDEDDGKSSLVFVFDTTGSMYNDLKQLREGAEMILNTALEESDVIADFVFVPFHDPAVGPATVTKDKEVFQAALNIVKVYGGGDCPEKSLGGIQLALNVSRPRSFIYVFTDATASDHRLVGNVLDAIQRKQSQVVFVLTGHCNDLHRPHFKVYQRIAAASSGQIFNLNKTSVHKVLDFVRSSIAGRTVNLRSAVNPPGYDYTQGIPIDSNLHEVTVSVSGAKPSIRVVNPSGQELTGPPQLVTTLDLSEIMVVKVLQPEPGNWTIMTGSEEDHSVKVVGVSNLTFNHGFSVERPASMAETSYRPLQGAYNHMMIALTQTDRPVQINYAEILTLEGRMLFELPLKEVDSQRKIYLAEPFVPPDDFFYIAINGLDEYNQDLRRIGATAVQAKPPDVPYLTVPKKVEARAHETVVLTCAIESLVPLTAMWTKDTVKIHPQVTSLQSTSIQYTINEMSEDNVGTYRCVVKNVAGLSKAATEVILIVDPPQVEIAPANQTVEIGENIVISCTVVSDALLLKYQLVFNGTLNQYATDVYMEPNIEGLYVFNKTLHNASERDSGIYTCVAANRGGEKSHSTQITVQTQPTAQILGPHTLTKLKHTVIQLMCHVEHAQSIMWVAPNSSVVKHVQVEGVYNDMFDVEVSEGVWNCVAVRGGYNASDSLEIIVLIKPEVSIEGPKTISVINGTKVEIICNIVAKPAPRIIWHRETEDFLNNTITAVPPDVYRSVLTLDSSKENVDGTYFCFGENSEGIHQDSVALSVRRRMVVYEGFADTAVQLYSQISLSCRVDCYPQPTILWYHNDTDLTINDNLYLSENNNTLYILKVDFDDLGSYKCEVDNGFENLKIEGSLNVFGLENPKLAKEPAQKIAEKGKSSILTCRILKGNPDPNISWQYKNDAASVFSGLPNGVIPNKDNTELIIANLETKHQGLYRCTAENVIGKDTYEVSLLVQYPPELEQESPEDQPLTVESGRKVTLSCKARGNPPPIVIWTKDSQPVPYSKNVYLTDKSDLVIEKATTYDSGLFTCNVTSALGSSHRNFTLFVYVPPVIIPPDIDPEIEVLEGDLVELPCKALGEPRPSVQWLQNGQVVQDYRKYADEFGLRFVANLTDFGEYTCTANNQYGNASFSFSVYIWVAPYIEPPLEMSINVLVGTDTSLECNVVGFPIPTVTWEYQNQLLEGNTTDVSFNDYGNLYITNTTSKNEGLYSCIAENIAGVARKYTYIHINEPPTILEDEFTGPYVATTQDTQVVLSCRTSGKPRPFVVWHKDDSFIDKDSRFDVGLDGTLTIKAPSEELSGQYICIAKNLVGTANKTLSVEIYALPTRIQADESHTSLTVLEGSNATADCPIRGSNKDKVKWYKDAKLISTDILQIFNITRNNASTYACVVTNAIGSAYSNVIINVEWPPMFTSKGGDVEVVKGDDWYFDCGVDAKPAAKTKWLFNSKLMLGEDNDRLKLINIQLYQTGVYKCIVSNPHGTVTKQFTLDVLVPPFISEFDLLDVQLKEGMNATLDCIARGSPTPTVLWTYNNTNWHLQDTSLITYNVAMKSEGLYRCDAVNKAGATHMVYRVSVASPARIEEITLFRKGQDGGVTVTDVAEVIVNTNIRLSCKGTGHPSPTIQWIRNGNALSENGEDIGYADLVVNDVQTTHAGVYTCMAASDGGADDKRIKVDVLEPPKIFQNLFQNAHSVEDVTRLEVLSGQAFYLHCHPYGNPVPEVYWFKDNLPLRLFDDTMESKDYGEVLVSNGATVEQSGNYTCVAKNKVGNASLIYLVDVLVPPPVPKESLRSFSTKLGKQLILTCPAEGTPAPVVMWIKHPYTEIDEDDPRITLSEDHLTLIINKTEVPDSGKYSCIMTNKVGTTEVVYNVNIEKPPSIAGNIGDDISENLVVPLRRSVVLKCQADGNPPPNISWLKDTQYLSESLSNVQRVLGNSLLAVWSATSRDAGQYICVAENSAGTAHRRYNVQVQVPGKWSAWTQWSLCNVSCGLGYQQRGRLCQYIDEYNVTYDKSTKSDKIVIDESGCKGPASDRRKCHMPACSEEPRWSVWGKWGACSTSCGVGSQARTRRCRAKDQCTGDNVQIRKCPNLPKCVDGSEQPPSVNEVYSSKEEEAESSVYIPEATFEMQPELIPQSLTDAEEFINTENRYPTVLFDVNVTENLDRSYRGPCDPGYSLNNITGSCEDIDECAIENNMCHLTQTCENTRGGYRCTCMKGFTSLGAGQRCLDMNECVRGIDGCEYACVNTAGGYVCACPRHLRLHRDKHHCTAPSLYRKPLSHEDLNSGEYLSTSVDFPTRYLKNRN